MNDQIAEKEIEKYVFRYFELHEKEQYYQHKIDQVRSEISKVQDRLVGEGSKEDGEATLEFLLENEDVFKNKNKRAYYALVMTIKASLEYLC